MSVFTFKPALLAGSVTYEVSAQGLVCSETNGARKWQLQWGDVTAAAFVEHRVKAAQMRRLDLLTGQGGDTRSISFTSGPGSPDTDPDAVAHLDLVAAILDQLAVRTPRFQVSVGEYGRARVTMFAIGIIAAAGALGLGGLMLATGVSSDRLAAGIVPVLLLAGMGALLIHAHAPWRDLPQMSAAGLAKALGMIAHPDAPGK